MKNTKKGSILFIVIILVLIAGGIFIYFSTKNTAPSTIQNSDLNITPDPTKPSLISVTSPREGDKLTIGKTYTVTWTSLNVGDQALFIAFTDPNGGNAKWYITEIKNTGSYTATLDSRVTPGNYRIRVFTGENIPTGANTAVGSSGVVTIE
jgi:hypothetical protein